MAPSTQELIERLRNAHDPTPADRELVRAKLAARIGAGAGTKALLSSWGVKLGVPIAIAGVIVAWALLRDTSGSTGPAVETPHLVSTPPVVATAQPPPVVAVPPPVVEPPTASPPVVAVPSPRRDASHAPARVVAPRSHVAETSDFDAEMAAVAAAQAAIQRGNFSEALSKLDAADAAFPNGVLGEERAAARVVALCIGGQSEGRERAKLFLDRYPHSPLAVRVKTSCALP